MVLGRGIPGGLSSHGGGVVAWVRSRDVQSLGTGVGSLSGLCGGHRSSGW